MLKLIVTLKQAPRSNMVSMQEGTNIVIREPEEAMLTFDDERRDEGEYSYYDPEFRK